MLSTNSELIPNNGCREYLIITFLDIVFLYSLKNSSIYLMDNLSKYDLNAEDFNIETH